MVPGIIPSQLGIVSLRRNLHQSAVCTCAAMLHDMPRPWPEQKCQLCLLQVDKPWEEVYKLLPEPLYRHQYGT